MTGKANDVIIALILRHFVWDGVGVVGEGVLLEGKIFKNGVSYKNKL